MKCVMADVSITLSLFLITLSLLTVYTVYISYHVIHSQKRSLKQCSLNHKILLGFGQHDHIPTK